MFETVFEKYYEIAMLIYGGDVYKEIVLSFLCRIALKNTIASNEPFLNNFFENLNRHSTVSYSRVLHWLRKKAAGQHWFLAIATFGVCMGCHLFRIAFLVNLAECIPSCIGLFQAMLAGRVKVV